MNDQIKMAVLQHLKNLMDGEMAKDIPSKGMSVTHELPAETHVTEGEDEEGNPMMGLEHSEGMEKMGLEPLKELPSLDNLKKLDSGTDKAKEKIEVKAKHPLFEKSKEHNPEDDNHSMVAMLKRAKKNKE